MLEQDTFIPDVHLEENRFLDRLIIISRRRKFIFLFTLGAAIFTALIVLLVPNRYTAQTIVLPPAQNSSMGAALLSQLTGSSALASVAGAGLGIKSPGDMYVSLFRSQTVEDAVIHRFNLISRYKVKKLTDARNAFEKHSTVVLGAKDGLIRVAVTDYDPKMAADIANGFVDEFRKLNSGLATTEASQRRVFFQQQLLEADQNLTNAEEAMKNTEQSTGVLQIDSQTRALVETAAELRAQIMAKQVQLRGMSAYATSDNPQVIEVKQQLAALQGELAQIAGNDPDAGPGLIVPKGKVPEAGLEYLRKLRDVKYYETVSELIARQFELAKLDEAREGAIVQVADIATPPDKKSSPHRALIVVLIAMIAFVIAVLWVFAEDRWQRALGDTAKSIKIQTLCNTFRK